MELPARADTLQREQSEAMENKSAHGEPVEPLEPLERLEQILLHSRFWSANDWNDWN